MTYIGNTTFKHGNDFGQNPAGTVVFAAGEEITSIFGDAGSLINSIGFKTSWGAVYGPWGGGGGVPYLVDGPVYGFYGGVVGDVVSAFGIWTTDSPSAPPPPAPNPTGMVRSKMFGTSSATDGAWDDHPTFAGNSQSA